MAAPTARIVSVCQLCGRTRFQLRNKLFHSILRTEYRHASTATNQNPVPPGKNPNTQPIWQPVVGLEIHAQIQAESKLFSGSSAQFGGPVNSQVAFLDTALPGTLPVLNKRCVEAGVITALALGCNINKVSMFDRKHYFYADLPAGYQITQQRQALANGGYFTFLMYGQKQSDCVERTVRITQLQLEQDSGKSLHDEEEKMSLIDLNRAGCALMEIVTEPDFKSGDDARAFVRDLRMLLMTIGTCDGRMSEGSLRVDANISVHRPDEPLGVRSEVKNLNSLSSVKKSIEFEISRQIKVLEAGGEVVNETRSFDIDSGETLTMRDKETKQDYRFMPEPNLPPLHVYTSDNVPTKSTPVVVVNRLGETIPRLPRETREYLMQKYELTLYHAALIVNEGFLGYHEELVQDRDTQKMTSFMIHEFMAPVLEREMDPSECRVPAAAVRDLYDWYTGEEVSLNTVQKVMEIMLDGPLQDPKTVIDDNNLWQINDENYLTDICQQIIDANPKPVAKFKRGKKKAINKLMGKARTLTHDRGNPVKISKIFKKLMSE